MTGGADVPGVGERYDAWAEFYDLTEGDRSAICAYYASLVGPGVRSLLDLGCGTGIITTDMARRIAPPGPGEEDTRVVGIDSSSRMLAEAASRNPRIDWCRGDMCHPPVAGTFDLVTCCYNTLMMLPGEAEVSQVMTAVNGLLSSDGRFAFDLFQPDLPSLRAARRDRLLHAYSDQRGRRIELRQDTSFDEDAMLLTMDWRLVDATTGERLGDIRYLLRQHSHAAMRRMLEGAGLRIVELYGDYDRRPFDAGSMRQVVVCMAA